MQSVLGLTTTIIERLRASLTTFFGEMSRTGCSSRFCSCLAKNGGSLCVTESAIQPLLGCELCMVFVWWVYVEYFCYNKP